MKSSGRKHAAALLLLASLVGCSRCGHPTVAPSGRSAAELAPAQAAAALYVPHLLPLGQKVTQLSKLRIFGLLATLAGAGDDGSALVAQAKRQLGFDFTTAEGLEKIGLDPQGPLLSAKTGPAQLVVAGVGDGSRLDAAVGILAKERLRAPERSEQNGVTLYAAQGSAPVLAYARSGGFALLCTGATCPALVAAGITQKPSASLAGNPSYSAFVAAHAGSDLIFWAPAENPFKSFGLDQGLALAATVEAHRLRAELELPLSTAQATALASLNGEAGSALVAKLDPDAFLVARTALDPATFAPVFASLAPRGLSQAIARLGLDPGELLAALKPGAALSLSLPAQMNLARMPSFDPRETNPFRYVNLAALGALANPEAAAKMLAAVSKASGQVGATVKQAEVGKASVYTFEYALGEGASIAQEGSQLFVSGGQGRMAGLLSRGDGAGPKLPADATARFSKAGLAVWLDLPRVVRSLRALPDSAFGLGGFAIKAAMDRWLVALDEVKGALLFADTKADSQGSTLHVTLQADLP